MKRILFLNLFTVLLAVFLLFPTNAQVQAATYSDGIDYPGGDLYNLKSSSLESCAQSCDEQPACLAWTFDNNTQICYLKDQVLTPKQKGVDISSTAAFPYEVGLDRPGNDLSSFTMRSYDPQMCVSACSSNKDCDSFTIDFYELSNPKCYLKSGQPVPVPKSGDVSGLMDNFL